MNISSALHTDRICASLTGLRIREFQELATQFRWNYLEYLKKAKPNRKRALGGGRSGNIQSVEEKLLFILFYLKSYPTYDVLSFVVGFHRTRACQWTLHLLPVLKQTLGRKLVLPQRRISSVEEFLRLYPEVKDVFGDATERRIQRPKNQRKQKKTYSGKKKIHGRKNVVLADEKRRILVLTKTKSARRHDKRLADKQNLFQNLPEKVALWVDTGFEGVQNQHTNTLIPVKKKRKSKHNPNPLALTQTQKEGNRLISSFRVLAEHAICGMKRYNCLQHPYRNKKTKMDDQLALLASGLWNYHLSFST